MLVGGWYLVRPKVMSMAQERIGYTGEYPVVPQPPIPARGGHHDEKK